MLATWHQQSFKGTLGRDFPDGEDRMDRKTACLRQADAFRERALADPEHHDQWIDEAITWLERAREAGCRVSVNIEGDGEVLPSSSGAAGAADSL